jgi:hypothetical protein
MGEGVKEKRGEKKYLYVNYGIVKALSARLDFWLVDHHTCCRTTHE